MRAGDSAWIAILGYEMAAPQGELLSEAMDRYRRAHPWIVAVAISYGYLHLMRVIPERYDLLTQLAIRVRRCASM